MILSPQQAQAIDAVARWLAGGDSTPQVFRLFGYAGTGKTTLARDFAESLGPGEVFFAAYTGKAALVLRQKGCYGASTLHQLIYVPQSKSRGRLNELEEELRAAEALPDDAPVATGASIFERARATTKSRKIAHLLAELKAERSNLSKPSFGLNSEGSVLACERTKLVVVDEVSMVDNRLGEDLLSFGVKILVLGDPAQLPPVRGSGFFTRDEDTPDVLLTEIHRQAQDNPIIRLATLAREGRPIPLGRYGDSEVIERYSREVDLSARVMNAGQVLCGRNRTRQAANAKVRRLLGRVGQLPEKGDKLVCLKNNHQLGLLNGSLWETLDAGARTPFETLPLTIASLDQSDIGSVEIDAWAYPFLGGDGSDLSWWERKEAEEFDYGNALTVHKSQGSQWDDVVVLDESLAFRESAGRHLYTAITRAAERVTIVRGY